MTFPVLWWMPDVEREPDASPYRLTWDAYLVEEMLTDLGGQHSVWDPDDLPEAAVVVIPCGRYHPDVVQTELEKLDAAVVVLTSDETALFDSSGLKHRNARWWVADPRPDGRYPEGARFLPCGYPPHTRSILAGLPWSAACRDTDWVFYGQVNHRHRRQLVAALERIGGGDLRPSKGFAQGVTQSGYLRALAGAKVAPCPSGPGMADSFRVWEALEAGCVPVVEAGCPAYPTGFWDRFLAGDRWFPMVESWDQLPELMPYLLDEWPGNATRIQARWGRYKRDLEWRLWDDWNAVTGEHPPPHGNVTVLIPTSPIASHPSTEIIEQTVASVRHHLPQSEIIVMADGVRAEQEHYRPRYQEYLRRLGWLAAHEFGRCTLHVHDTHQHQANMTGLALTEVRTPMVLFVEHDTPLCADQDINWAACEGAILRGALNVVRFHYEAHIPHVHDYLMVDKAPVSIGGLPCVRTRQWSQRPHLASTVYYRRMLANPAWFPRDARTMIEDVWHSPVMHEPWDRHRVAIYHPFDGHIKRSWNLDGRQADPKYDMVFGTRAEA